MKKIAIGILLLWMHGLMSCGSTKRCVFVGEFSNPNPSKKMCGYKCRGYGAIATFEWDKNKPCPPSFDGNFPGP
ncbi:hypothetical protein IQ235_07930 [Oscillatoriales cyanobacterium LEGE 11467]|uniref:Uncharacterized protein n=1 Tax=Zarconia navalis LEGE 11467 TaxID=1828826 RepID=A0A928VUY2_9CYAN|nr:hypothetical protein [Zarconia navalis]MBE9040707.1 hypothetical protein [Zarconia navalis LEGE 11467]